MVVSKQLVSKYDPSKAYNGYTLFGTSGSRDAYLVDMKGRFVQHWRLPHIHGNPGKLLPNGNLLIPQKIPGGPVLDLPGSGGQLHEIDWDSNLVWKYDDPYMNAHEFNRLKNGNTLIGHWTAVPSDIAAKVKGGIPGSEREGVIWGDCPREVTPDGKVVWEWVAHEHMDFETDVLCPLCPRDTLSYINSLTVLPDENILTNFRILNTVAIIDKGTGGFLWKWGPGELGHAHNPTLVDNGNILIFDNGFHRPATSGGAGFAYSRVIEVDMKTNEIKWEYKDENPFSFFSPICGSAQRLPNGNTLICESTKGRIFEVTTEKEIVWEFTNPFYFPYRTKTLGINNLTFRAYRYGPDYGGLSGKTLDPGRFEWVLQEKGPAEEEATQYKEKIVSRRLTGLGY